MSFKEIIQARARELGFDACRCTTAAPPASAPRLHEWLARQEHGQMAWLARNAPKRADPQLVLPGARSIIVLAAAYAAGGGPASPPRSTGEGFIARYARQTDYHQVLGGSLASLAELVNELGGPGTRSLWYVDTGPVLERDLAQRAGLGFAGKHTNLISRTHGNWILLGEILTTLDLPPDPPEKNRCGSCTRCLEACPTGAIVAPFDLDARRCISYLTIELKGAIPAELRPALGRRIFGCDDCLEACPWNRFAQAGRLLEPLRRAELEAPDLLGLLALDEAGFRARFGGTPVQRLKRQGLRRNVCVALGNTGGAGAVPALEKAAQGEDPLIAEHARWAVEQIQKRPVAADNLGTHWPARAASAPVSET